MWESCPIRQPAGELRWRREGAYTLFEGRCADPGSLVRLSVYGGGAEGYLGVMEPEAGGLTLRRKLSRAAMTGFPDPIEYAAESGKTAPAPPHRPASPATDTLWFAVGDGTLYTRRDDGPWLAVPLIEGKLPPAARERRVIEGIEYALIPLKENEKGY